MILDTNALSAFLDRTPEAVKAVSEAREIEIPAIVAGEYAFGIAQSRHREAYERSLQRMLERAPYCKSELRRRGTTRPSDWNSRVLAKPIPGNDFWIAALSRSRQLQ